MTAVTQNTEISKLSAGGAEILGNTIVYKTDTIDKVRHPHKINTKGVGKRKFRYNPGNSQETRIPRIARERAKVNFCKLRGKSLPGGSGHEPARPPTGPAQWWKRPGRPAGGLPVAVGEAVTARPVVTAQPGPVRPSSDARSLPVNAPARPGPLPPRPRPQVAGPGPPTPHLAPHSPHAHADGGEGRKPSLGHGAGGICLTPALPRLLRRCRFFHTNSESASDAMRSPLLPSPPPVPAPPRPGPGRGSRRPALTRPVPLASGDVCHTDRPHKTTRVNQRSLV